MKEQRLVTAPDGRRVRVDRDMSDADVQAMFQRAIDMRRQRGLPDLPQHGETAERLVTAPDGRRVRVPRGYTDAEVGSFFDQATEMRRARGLPDFPQQAAPPAPPAPPPLPAELAEAPGDDETARRLRTEMLALRDAGDRAGARVKAAELAGYRSAAGAPETLVEGVTDRGETALRSAAQGVFGLGEPVAALTGAAVDAVREFFGEDRPDVSVAEREALHRGRRLALEAQHPVTAVAGGLAGSVAGGMGAARAAYGLATRAGGMAGTVARALDAPAGAGMLRTGASLAGQGALGGAITGGVTHGTAEGALEGATAGGLFGGAAGLGAYGLGHVARAVTGVASPSVGAIMSLRTALGEDSPDALMATLRQRSAAAGRPLALAQALTPEQAAEAAGALQTAASPAITTRMRAFREAQEEAAKINLARAAAPVGIGVARVETDAKRAADAFMGKFGDTLVPLSNREADFFLRAADSYMKRSPLRRDLWRLQKDPNIKLRDLDAIRRTFAAQADTSPDMYGLKKIADEARRIGEDSVEGYGKFISDYHAAQETAEGIAVGRGAMQGSAQEFQDAVSLAGAPKQAGIGIGTREGVAERLRGQGGAGMIDRLAHDATLQDKLLAGIGTDADRLLTMARAESDAAVAARAASPIGIGRAEAQRMGETATDLAIGGASLQGNTVGALQASIMSRILRRILGSEERAMALASALTDPEAAPRVEAHLRQLGLWDRVLAESAAATTRATAIGMANE